MTHRDTNSIGDDYDRLAGEYARRISKELEHKPLDRQLLDRFAADVSGRGDVCDIGCGPGHVARYLRDSGLNVFGVDISPLMLEQARQLSPDISFREGNMLSLDLPDAQLAGIAAFYAIVNIPKRLLPLAFREMVRVLKPDGLLLLTFHIGDEVLHLDELWDTPISMDFFFPVRFSGVPGTCEYSANRPSAVVSVNWQHSRRSILCRQAAHRFPRRNVSRRFR